VRKHVLAAALLIGTASILSACGRGNSTQPVLQGAEDARSVSDFSHFIETELPEEETQTESETEEPVHIRPVQPETVKMPETERQTEKQTEAEAAFEKDYDFSETAVSPAVFGESASVSRAVTQDPASMTRTVEAEDGSGKKVIYTADPTRGATNGKIEIIFPSGEEGSLRQALISFDNGITEENADKFMEGGYTGNGPLLGLEDASISEDESGIHVILQKFPSDAGTGTPGWENDFQTDIAGSVGSDKYHESSLISVIQSLELASVTETEAGQGGEGAAAAVTKRYAPDGSVVSTSMSMHASYTAGTHSYMASLQDGTLTISVSREDCSSTQACMAFADRIYRYFYEGQIDLSFDLSAGDYTNERCAVHKTDAGFDISLHAAAQAQQAPQTAQTDTAKTAEAAENAQAAPEESAAAVSETAAPEIAAAPTPQTDSITAETPAAIEQPDAQNGTQPDLQSAMDALLGQGGD